MHVYFWKKIGYTIYEEACKNTIRNLVSNALTSKQIERLRGAKLLCCRINQKDRLFFRIIKDKLLILAISPHNYKTEHFLNPKVLNTCLEKNIPLLDQGLVSDSDFEMMLPHELFPSTLPDNSLAKEATLEIAPAYLQNSTYYVLDEVQQQAFAIGNNGVIVGDPGTGKTLVAFLSMDQELEKISAELAAAEEAFSSLPIGYVVKSSVLCGLQRKEWLKSHDSESHTQFVTLKEILHRILKLPDDNDTLVDDHYFYQWLEKYLPILRAVQKARPESNSLPEAVTNNLSKVYQELCLLAGYMPENPDDLAQTKNAHDQYSNLGQQETLFYQQGAWFIKTYALYCQHLANSKKIDLNLVNFPIDKLAPVTKTLFRLLVVDELQDVSPRMYRLLRNVSETTLACYGRHQNHSNTLPFFEFLKNKLGCNIQILPYVYRSPANIFHLMEAYMALKKQYLGQQSKIEFSAPKLAEAQQKNPGTLLFLNNNTEITSFLQQHGKSTECCIITSTDLLPYAKQFTPLAFNIALINGAQFRIVVLLDLLALPIYKKIIQGCTEGAVEAMNSLITAVGRSTDCLVIAQSKPLHHALESFITPLRHIVAAQQVSPAIQSAPASQDEWLHKAQELAAHELHEQAEAIRERFASTLPTQALIPTNVAAAQTPDKLSADDKSHLAKVLSKSTPAASCLHLLKSANAFAIWFRPLEEKKANYYLIDRIRTYFNRPAFKEAAVLDAFEALIHTALITPRDIGDKIPPLYFLTSSDFLLTQLFALLRKKPELCTQITCDDLLFNRNSSRAKQSKKSKLTLRELVDRKNGKLFLNYVIDQNPQISQQIESHIAPELLTGPPPASKIRIVINPTHGIIMGVRCLDLVKEVLANKRVEALTEIINHPDAYYLLFANTLEYQTATKTIPLALITYIGVNERFDLQATNALKDKMVYNRFKALTLELLQVPPTQQKIPIALVFTGCLAFLNILADCLNDNITFAAQMNLDTFFAVIDQKNLVFLTENTKIIPFAQVAVMDWRVLSKLREHYKEKFDYYLTHELLNNNNWSLTFPNFFCFTMASDFFLPFLQEKTKEVGWISRLNIEIHIEKFDMLIALICYKYSDVIIKQTQESRIEIFILLIENHPDLAKKITADYLLKFCNKHDFFEECILQRLEQFGDLGIRAFNALLNKNPSLINELANRNAFKRLPLLDQAFKQYTTKQQVSHLSCFAKETSTSSVIESAAITKGPG